VSEHCPKCGAPRADRYCPKCGLEYERFDPDKVQAAIPDSVVVLWENLEKNWDDTAAHALFVEEGLRRDAAGFVAASYREKGDDPIATMQLEKLTARLVESLAVQSSAAPATTGSMKQIVYVLLFCIIALLAFVIIAQYIR
jgi:rubredoxin